MSTGDIKSAIAWHVYMAKRHRQSGAGLRKEAMAAKRRKDWIGWLKQRTAADEAYEYAREHERLAKALRAQQ